MPHGFIGLEHRDQRQQAQPRHVAVDAMRVNQRLAQHLQTTTDTQHRTALPRVLGDSCVKPLRTQPGQVGTGGFGAGQDDPVGGFQTRQLGR
ncbi:hypothetical protein GALL_496050 [mine drainage metagenome]|uniref:Uncharacterized protein n=1 Tax=mine drainage metagenome TaxID=410659 RepID=A0A1J5PYS6_9ZZZZ